jgi:hypothetical protein
MEETGKNHFTCLQSLTNFIIKCCIEYLAIGRNKFTTSVAIRTDCVVKIKYNYHMYAAMMALISLNVEVYLTYGNYKGKMILNV